MSTHAQRYHGCINNLKGTNQARHVLQGYFGHAFSCEADLNRFQIRRRCLPIYGCDHPPRKSKPTTPYPEDHQYRFLSTHLTQCISQPSLRLLVLPTLQPLRWLEFSTHLGHCLDLTSAKQCSVSKSIRLTRAKDLVVKDTPSVLTGRPATILARARLVVQMEVCFSALTICY